MNNKLYVGGLSYDTTEDELKNHFGGAGAVTSASIIMDRETNRSRGFGFVEMSSEEEANKAIEMFNEKDFAGRNLTVNIAKITIETRAPIPRWFLIFLSILLFCFNL